MITGKQKSTENLKFRAITSTGIATFLFAKTGGYKTIKKEKKKKQKKKRKKKIMSSGKFLLHQVHLPLALQL